MSDYDFSSRAGVIKERNKLRAENAELREALDFADERLRDFMPESCDVYWSKWEALTPERGE